MLESKGALAAYQNNGDVLAAYKYRATMVRLRQMLLPVVMMAVDYLAVLAAIWTAYYVRQDVFPRIIPADFQSFAVPLTYMYLIPLAFILFMHFDRLYTRRLPFWQHSAKVFKASIYAMLFVLVMIYALHAAGDISRIFLTMLWVATCAYLLISNLFVRKLLAAAGLWRIPVVVIGAGKTAKLLVKAFKADGELGYSIAGMVEDSPETAEVTDYPVIGTFDTAEYAVRRIGVKNVLIAAPGLDRDRLLDLIYRLQPCVDNITFVPDLFGVPVGAMELDTLLNEKTVLLKIRNNLAHYYNCLLKRGFDLLASASGMIVVLPLIAVISCLIYLDNPGPVIFAHRRIGKDGKLFSCYKFRSMTQNAEQALADYLEGNPIAREEWQRDFKLKDDPRITRIGAFLRKTSLDELPQLFNVLLGEMSLVGPRPIVSDEVAKYDKFIYDYYLVRPGITGIWQTSGRNDTGYDERVQMDSWYVRNWSLWLDIMLLFKTVNVVLKGKGAY